MRWFCETCGIVARRELFLDGDGDPSPPICRHNVGVTPGPAVSRMIELPEWHPLYADVEADETDA